MSPDLRLQVTAGVSVIGGGAEVQSQASLNDPNGAVSAEEPTGLTGTLWNHGAQPLQWGVVVGLSLLAALTDLRSRRVPNALTAPMLLAGLARAWWLGGAGGLADAAAGCALMAAPYVLLFIFAGGGAGDAKLMGALGAWLGLINGAVALAAVALCGMVLAVAFALARRRMGAALANIGSALRGAYLAFWSPKGMETAALLMPASQSMQKIPYAVAIFGGILMAGGGLLLWRA